MAGNQKLGYVFLGAFVSLLCLGLLRTGQYITLDDGYYYLEIARHIARGDGFTFDGQNPTNGFHPLWQFLLVPIFWLTESPEHGEWGAFLQIGMLLLGSAWLFYRIAAERHAPGTALFGSLAWILLNYRLFVMGVEYGLQVFLLLAVVGRIQGIDSRRRPIEVADYLGLGVLLSLLFLARLDGFLLAVVLLAVLARRRIGVISLAAVIAPVMVAVVLFSAFGLLFFGQIATVSGAVKAETSRLYLEADPAYQGAGWAAAKLANALRPLGVPSSGSIAVSVFGYAALLAAHTLFLRPIPGWRAWFNCYISPLLPFILYGWLSFAFFVLVYHDGLSYQPWYYAVHRWLPVMGLLAILEAVPARLQKFRLGFLVLVSAVLGVGILGFAYGLVPVRQPFVEAAAATDWINRNLGEDAVLGSWNAGYLGYHARPRLVNLDGLVNSWAYFESDRSDLCAYWEREGIQYLVDYFDMAGVELDAPHLPHLPYLSCLDDLEVIWELPVEGQAWALKVISAPRNGR